MMAALKSYARCTSGAQEKLEEEYIAVHRSVVESAGDVEARNSV